jgi:DNA-binding LacI/PurR family transcriptional regulator
MSEKGPATITGIAEQLGLSHATVSYVLSGKAKKNKVSFETVGKVREMAHRLNYVPNQAAQSLVKRRSGTISVLFHDLRMDWANDVLQGISSVLLPKEYTPFLAVHRAVPKIFEQEITSVCKRRDEGLLCHPSICVKDYKQFSPLTDMGIPIVFMGDVPEGWADLPTINSVIWNCGPAVKLLIRHLIETGRRRIAFFGVSSGNDSDIRRLKAYQETLEDAGLDVKKEWIVWSQDEKVGKDVKSLFANKRNSPDAVFALNDSAAIMVLAELDRLGIEVPGDVALAGVGDLTMVRNSRIALTTMREPLYEIGKISAEIIMDIIRKPDQPAIKRFINYNELKIRKTT